MMSNIFYKMGRPRPLFNLFSSFQTNITILQQINVKKCPSSIQCWDSNPWLSEHVSPPITTRPGLPPKKVFVKFSSAAKHGWWWQKTHNIETMHIRVCQLRGDLCMFLVLTNVQQTIHILLLQPPKRCPSIHDEMTMSYLPM